MKLNKIVFCSLLSVALFSACSDTGKKPSSKVAADSPQMALSANDTASVLRLTNDFLELITSGRVDDAISCLYILDGDEILPLPVEHQEGFRELWNAFDIKGYAINSFTFKTETDTKVNYSLYLKDPTTSRNPPAIKGLIEPVRRDGSWYITLANVEGEIQQNYRKNN